MPQIQTYLRIALHNWWIIALAALSALNVALFASYRATPMFRARTSFIVSPSAAMLAEEERDVVRSIEVLNRPSIVATYAEILGSKRAFVEAGAAVGLTPAQLEQYQLKAVELPGAGGIELSVEGSDPQMVSLMANAAGEWGLNYIEELYQVFDIKLLDVATLPTNPYSPDPLRNVSVALFLGVVLGFVLAVLKEHLYQDSTEAVLVTSLDQ